MDETLDSRSVRPRLEAARADLARFELFPCGMAHEQIRRGPDGRYPLPNAAVDHGLLRAEYCDSRARSTRLACAHTGARKIFLALLDSLPAGVIAADRIAGWKAEVEELDLAIVAVDWRKSDCELAHARRSALLCTDGGSTPANVEELEALAEEIEALVREHRGYLDRLAGIRDDVSREIDAAIAGSSRDHAASQ